MLDDTMNAEPQLLIREFLTGFHKRKLQRTEERKTKRLEREKQGRLEARREVSVGFTLMIVKLFTDFLSNVKY